MVCKTNPRQAETIKKTNEPGVVMQACNHNTVRRPRWEDLKFKASVGYVVRLCLKKKKKEK
jgi:hypothetical protein